MSGFFSDNQTKQKAYDRYYNQVARSDFVQGRKLRALIDQENADETSTDSLANLYQQVMSKSRDYDYDKITQKMTKGVGKPIKGESSSSFEDVKQNPRKQSSKKKHTFVPESTDTQANTGNKATYEEMFNDENFMKYMDDINYHKMKKGLDSEQLYQDRIRKYMTKNKEFRHLVFKSKRKMSKEDIDDKATDLARLFIKRKREIRAPKETSPNLRPMSKIKMEDNERKMSSEDLNERGKTNLNQKVMDHFNKVVDDHKSANRTNLYKDIQNQFKEVVDSRKGKNYFEEHAPKMSGRQSKKI